MERRRRRSTFGGDGGDDRATEADMLRGSRSRGWLRPHHRRWKPVCSPGDDAVCCGRRCFRSIRCLSACTTTPFALCTSATRLHLRNGGGKAIRQYRSPLRVSDLSPQGQVWFGHASPQARSLHAGKRACAVDSIITERCRHLPVHPSPPRYHGLNSACMGSAAPHALSVCDTVWRLTSQQQSAVRKTAKHPQVV